MKSVNAYVEWRMVFWPRAEGEECPLEQFRARV